VEVVRLADLRGVRHASVESLASSLGPDGGDVCAFKDKAASDRQREFGRGIGLDALDQPLNQIIRQVYCP